MIPKAFTNTIKRDSGILNANIIIYIKYGPQIYNT